MRGIGRVASPPGDVPLVERLRKQADYFCDPILHEAAARIGELEETLKDADYVIRNGGAGGDLKADVLARIKRVLGWR